MEPIPVIDRAGLSLSELQAIQVEVANHRTLKIVLDWCLAQDPSILETDVVTQDEFTHDLVVPKSEDIFLVYDSN